MLLGCVSRNPSRSSNTHHRLMGNDNNCSSGSCRQVWQHSTLQYYGGQSAAGRPLPAAYQGVEDDPHQMGGDFVLDDRGRLRLVHCSTSPPDRPSVPTLLRAAAEACTEPPAPEMGGASVNCADNRETT